MTTATSLHRYPSVGPPELRHALGPAGFGCAEPRDFADRLSAHEPRDLAEPFTFVVTSDGCLRLARRRSEHGAAASTSACAGGESVRATGEITFSGARSVSRVTNHSTGYCPDIASWHAAAGALERLGLSHPGASTPW